MMPMLIRADASIQIGTGHVMRSLALAQGWRDGGGNVVFVLRSASPVLLERLAADHCRVVLLGDQLSARDDLDRTIDIARQAAAECVVVDGYQFDAHYQAGIKEAGFRLLWVDDYGHAEHYVADFVLNHNLYANESFYINRAKDTRLLLGSRYVPLRREFRQLSRVGRNTANIARNILVTLGGSDPHNTTVTVLKLIRQGLEDYKAMVVVGAANPFRDALSVETARHKASCVEIVEKVSDMASRMLWADIAISAGGTTAYELAFMGLPSLLVMTADNQRRNVAAFEASGAFGCLGWHADMSVADAAKTMRQLVDNPERRDRMSRCGRELIDGYGVDRVEAILRGCRLRLRDVNSGDCRLIWEWANAPLVRAVSFTSRPIEWDEHQAWFNARLADPSCHFYAAVDALDQVVGHIRFDVRNGEAAVSITVSSELHGKGYGREILLIGAERMFTTSDVKVVYGLIKRDNEASLRAFSGAGFLKAGDAVVNGCESVRFEIKRGNAS